jgi:hypothetical protein
LSGRIQTWLKSQNDMMIMNVSMSGAVLSSTPTGRMVFGRAPRRYRLPR